MQGTDERALLQTRLKSAFWEQLPIPENTEPHLAEALNETLQRTGNLIRGQIAYSVGRSYGLEEGAALQLAIAMEYFHTASLVFDDLPSMDDASLRRGATCIHRLFGEAPAILTALSLINRAYALLWKSVANAAAVDQLKALAYVERYLGLGGLLNGQSHDLHYAHVPSSERSPQKVAMGKTVALIRLSLVVPAMVGGATTRAIRQLDRLAVVWGLAYQALDDVKDVLHEADRAGKTTARDTVLDRPNLTLTLGVEATLARLDELVRVGTRLVSRLEGDDPSLACLQAPHRRLQREVTAATGELVGATL